MKVYAAGMSDDAGMIETALVIAPQVTRVRGRWPKGLSGNPKGGKSITSTPDYKECRLLARERSRNACQRMIDLMEKSLDDRVCFMAAQWVYEQAWGKAREYDPKEDAPSPINPLTLSAEQREQLRHLLTIASGRVPVAEAPSAEQPQKD